MHDEHAIPAEEAVKLQTQANATGDTVQPAEKEKVKPEPAAAGPGAADDEEPVRYDDEM
ncbi:hypothetical protein [Chitinophaga sp. YIM B06452]|uniref:hypothetical protein n=1 Tax=Chitinophaga sp. YIM B06452 TaxID=3082158 RepID=UPI0031FF2031